MNNNIQNMGAIHPNYNPQGKKSPEAAEIAKKEVEVAKEGTSLNCDPNCAIGRSMVKQNYKYDPKNTIDDVQTFKLVNDFAYELAVAMVRKGEDPDVALNYATAAAEEIFMDD